MTGHRPLRIAADFEPDVVILDIGMPVMDGYEVARRLRARPDFQETRLLALTGWGQANDREKSRAAGFDDHLVKPLDYETLRELLARDAARRPPAAHRLPDAGKQHVP